jgi:ADP-ribose pyrophosphatase
MTINCEFVPFNGKKDIKKIKVPSKLVSWDVTFSEYDANVPSYTAAKYLESDDKIRPSFADHPTVTHPTIVASLLKKQKKSSFKLDSNGLPLNPLGRRGIRGRGDLAEWGPQYAVDPILTKDAKKTNANGKPIMNWIGIRRKNGEIALPGGIRDKVVVDDSTTGDAYVKTSHVFLPSKETELEIESIAVAGAREFKEEALGKDVTYGKSKVDPNDALQNLFCTKSVLLYAGIVEGEERNTDNAWMETAAFNVHDASGKLFEHFVLKPGASETESKWCEYDPDAEPITFADHTKYLRLAYLLNYPDFAKL